MKVDVKGISIECVRGDIASQDGFDAIVNAANAELQPGGGVAGVIHRVAGPGLYNECLSLAPIKTGEAVITGGHNLPNRYVIHTLGPIYNVDENPAEKLADSYRNSIKRAEENKIKSIAFPSISTGIFGYPMEEATHIAFTAILESIPRLKTVKYIRFVLYSEQDLKIHETILGALTGNG